MLERKILVINNIRIPLLKRDTVYSIVCRNGKIENIYEDSIKIKGAESFDFKGTYAYPGFRDAHCHLFWLGRSLGEVQLDRAKSWEEVVAETKKAAKTKRKGEWIFGRGWDHEEWKYKELPTHNLLSEAVPNNPVWLIKRDGHAGIANKLAMDMAGIDKIKYNPEEGRIERDKDGFPTGVFVDKAMEYIQNVIPPFTQNDREEWFKKGQKECVKHGLVAVTEAGAESNDLEVLKKMHEESAIDLVVNVYVLPEKCEVPERPLISNDGLLRILGIKLFADGALGSWGAAMEEPYIDRPDSKGLLLLDSEKILEYCEMCSDRNLQVAVHAIGDRALRNVIDGIEKFNLKGNGLLKRPRIEHCQTCPRKEIKRMKNLGIIPSIQPSHLLSDKLWAIERLGHDRFEYSYLISSFIKEGVFPAGGSDFPVDSLNTLKGIYSAVTGGGWVKRSESISIEESLRLFSIWSAYANYEDNRTGEISKGKDCDITILDKDLMSCKPEEILSANFVATIVHGRVVWNSL